MLSSISRDNLEKELESLKNDKLPEASSRLEEAKKHGDLRENEPYQIALQDISRIQVRIMEIEEILSTESVNNTYSTTIAPGTFISIIYHFEDGTKKDYGLFMMDAIGSSLYRTISPKSELGRKIIGTTGGLFQINDKTGRLVTVEVKVHGEDKLQDYLSLLPKDRENPYAEVFENES